MLRIHKPNHKLLILGIASICGIGGLLGLQALTYTPELSHAETALYPKPETRTMADITYMQDISPTICSNTPEADTEGNNQYQLKDSRDQKTYWVAKLKDGNCWMTQNLDLNIPASGLSKNDTDILEDWNASSTYKPEATQITSTPNFGTTKNNIKSWDPAKGGSATYCTNSRCNNVTMASSNGGHNAQGNYYSWGAATAGQAAKLVSNAMGEQSTQSICSKGWTLPTGGLSGRQFNTLLSGLTPAQITSSPYYFVYGGLIDINSLVDTNEYGYYWSSTAYNASHAYLLLFNTASIYPLNNSDRFAGISIRCVARTESIPNNNVEITINNTISLDTASEVVVEKSDTNPSATALPVSVASNQPYSVSISSVNPNLASTNGTTIPSKSGLLNTNENGWGIKLSSSSTYSQITSTPTTFYTASGAEVKTIPFTIGISTSPDLPNGEYSTAITVTATQN